MLSRVKVDPVLAVQGFLLANGSKLIVDRMINTENAYLFMFVEQPVPLHVVQIARQKFVHVECEGGIKRVDASDTIDPPTLCLHAVKQYALAGALDILANGFNYGVADDVFGIYTVDAHDGGSPLF